MNPTDEVDDLLTRAGARWRADQPSAPEPDLDQLVNGRRRPRRWVPALAAASVAAIAAAALTVLPDGTDRPAATPPGGSEQAFAQGNKTPNDEWLVRDGDRVQVSGEVIVVPGKDPVFCAPLPTLTDPGFGKVPETVPSCPADLGVKLRNFDPAKLAEVKTIKGVRTGYAQVTGVWSSRTIDVTEQQVPRAESTTAELNIPPDVVPCPAPAGGWKTVPNTFDKAAISRFLGPRENQSTDPRVLYPSGRGPGAPEVYAIGVAHGDLAAFRSAFEKVYSGNLCVYSAKFSESELVQLAGRVAALTPSGLGVYRTGTIGDDDKIGVKALVYDEALKATLTPVGLENLELEVDVKPLR